jgi:hypothetical protein
MQKREHHTLGIGDERDTHIHGKNGLVKTFPRRRRPNTDEERLGERPELRRRRRLGNPRGGGKELPPTPPFKYPA